MKRIFVLLLLAVAALMVAYGIITGVDKYLTVGRMWETPAVRPHEQALLIMEDGMVPLNGGEAILRATKGDELRSPIPGGDPMPIKHGEKLYFTYCAQCHGKYHDGNGTVGQSFYPLPTNLRSEKVQSSPEGILFKAISYGLPEGRQPPLAATISILDRWRIIAYVKSLGPRK